MTAGTAIEFAVTVVILLAAVIGGIWLESRMPDPQPQPQPQPTADRQSPTGSAWGEEYP